MKPAPGGPSPGQRGPGLALIGLPFDEGSSFLRGAAAAPRAIREALRSPAGNAWTESGIDLGGESAPFDAGDCDGSTEEAIAALLERDWSPIALGGDHAVTHPVVRAFARRHAPLDLLQFDAHPDLYDEYEGRRDSHACPFARIMEEGLVRRLVQVGIRTMNGHQREQARRFGVEVVEMRRWEDGWVGEFDAPLYVSIDLDVLDPAFAPGVSHREPGGASTRQLIAALQRLRARIVGADVVELNPGRDAEGTTALVAAKLVKELAAKMLQR